MKLDIVLPDGRETVILSGAERSMSLAEVLRRKHHPLNTRCGERDLCGGCEIELVEGSLRLLDGGETLASDGDARMVKACRVSLQSAATIRIPQRSLLSYEPQVVGDYRIKVPYARDPLTVSGLGACVDIGTTTVVVQVVDPADGRVLARAPGFNQQMRFGDDVLTRINLCSTDPTMLGTLQRAVLADTVQPLLAQAASEAGVGLERIACIVLSGNTTMLHLAAGVDPSSMGVAPFTPTFLEHRQTRAGELGLEPTDAEVHLLPGAGAYVGADLTSGVFASGLAYEAGPSLLVDVGTNGEIILKRGDRLYGCATAAGPAFEGSGLQSGIRAGKGAISHIEMAADPFSVEIEVIGGPSEPASGICGSAYVDFLSEGRRVGLLSHAGRFEPDFIARNGERFSTGEYGKVFQLARGQGGRPIVVTEPDVARLLQAKAAVASGILTLLEKEGVRADEVETLHLAGGFGMHLRLENAIGAGLLPGFRVDQVELVGNTSLAGATISFIDRNAIDELARIGREMELVELNLEPGFEDAYIDQLSLPDWP